MVKPAGGCRPGDPVPPRPNTDPPPVPGQKPSVTVTGSPGGDCECWCLWVTEEEYRRVVGEEGWERERQSREAMAASFREDGLESLAEETENKRWALYPDDLLSLVGIKDGELSTFTITKG